MLSIYYMMKLQKFTSDLTGHPHLIEYRDLFVLACLSGLRFSDFSNLRPEDLQKDMLYKKQEKSDHWVVIPLREEAKLIFMNISVLLRKKLLLRLKNYG